MAEVAEAPTSGGGVRELAELLSKLNPAAEEFVPPSRKAGGRLSADAPVFVAAADCFANLSNGGDDRYKYSKDSSSDGSADGQRQRRRRNGYNYGRLRVNQRLQRAQKDKIVRRTVYVADIDHQVTEEELAQLFATCGDVKDCRICGDPHSVLRFAFIEFEDEYGAREALNLGGTMLGFYPVRVLPSKTAILPVNPRFLPQSDAERDMCLRTVYCTNIEKKATQMDVKDFFESTCGEVSCLRLLGDNVHSTRIAFVEFALAESARMALNCSGMVLGDLPVRISPSKTPVRSRAP